MSSSFGPLLGPAGAPVVPRRWRVATGGCSGVVGRGWHRHTSTHQHDHANAHPIPPAPPTSASSEEWSSTCVGKNGIADLRGREGSGVPRRVPCRRAVPAGQVFVKFMSGHGVGLVTNRPLWACRPPIGYGCANHPWSGRNRRPWGGRCQCGGSSPCGSHKRQPGVGGGAMAWGAAVTACLTRRGRASGCPGS